MKNPAISGFAGFDFKTQADICVFTRLAADAAGATKMDRPEWAGVNPKNGEVYITLTNNSQRTAANVDAANPRAYSDMKGSKEQKGNVHGHIVRLNEGGKPANTGFKWDIYLFASEADADKASVNLSNLTDENDLSSPDGLVFSQATGLCWIQTDDGAYTDKTNCMLMAAVPGQVGDGGARMVKAGDKQVTTSCRQAARHRPPWRRLPGGSARAEITGITKRLMAAPSSSTTGRVPRPKAFWAPYAASKAGLLALTAKAARELARDGIAVNAVLPSVIETEMLGEIARGAEALERLRASFPIGRFGRPEEVASVVRFLCDEAPAYLTGEFICLRGGRL